MYHENKNSEILSFQILSTDDLQKIIDIAESIFYAKDSHSLFPIFHTGAIELVLNGFKAYDKREHFQKKNLNFENEYAKGIDSFKKLFHEDQVAGSENRNRLPVTLEIKVSPDSIILDVTTNAQMHPEEISGVKRIFGNESGKEDQADGEGGGIGLSMIISMLQNSGLDKERFHFSSENDKTIFSLNLPVTIEKDSPTALKIMDILNEYPVSLKVPDLRSPVGKNVSILFNFFQKVNDFPFFSGSGDRKEFWGMITTATGNGQETKSHSIEADFANTLYRAAKESFIVASYASQLATHFDLAPEMGYAIGLFHKIGKIILLNLEEEPIDKIRKLTGRKLPRNGLRNQESSLGISANLLGFLQSRHWNIPESIAYPVYFQDNPVASPEKYRPAACLLYLGKLIPDIRSGKEINKSHTVFSTIKYKFDEFLIISEKLTETTELHSDIMTQGRIK